MEGRRSTQPRLAPPLAQHTLKRSSSRQLRSVPSSSTLSNPSHDLSESSISSSVRGGAPRRRRNNGGRDLLAAYGHLALRGQRAPNHNLPIRPTPAVGPLAGSSGSATRRAPTEPPPARTRGASTATPPTFFPQTTIYTPITPPRANPAMSVSGTATPSQTHGTATSNTGGGDPFGNNTTTPPAVMSSTPPTVGMSAEMQQMLKTMLDNQRTMFKQDMDNALAARPVLSSTDRRREALALVNEATRTERKELLMAQGLSEGEALQALQEGATSTIVNQPSRRYNWRSEDIGLFEGDKLRLKWWMDRVRSLWEKSSDPMYRDPLIDALPLCLRGTAMDWYQALSLQERSSLTDWPAWEASLIEYFSMDRSQIRNIADQRKWSMGKEEISDYFQEKLRLLRQAYPDKGDADLVWEIKDGLPPHLRLFVCTDLMNKLTPSSLLGELRQLEGSFLEAFKLNKPGGGSAPATSSSKDKSTSNKSTSSSSNPFASGSKEAQRFANLEETFDIKNFSKVGKNFIYRIPGSDRIITLNRPCRHCGKSNHFDFMCKWLQEHDKKVDKGKKVKVEPVLFIDDYPVYNADLWLTRTRMMVDDSSDEEIIEVTDTEDESEESGSAQTTPSPDRRSAGKAPRKLGN